MANAKIPKTTSRRKQASVALAEAPTVHGHTMTTGTGGTSKSTLVTLLPISAIAVEDGFNPRKTLGDIDALATNIKAEGLLSALVVRPSDTEGIFNLIAGERRYRALASLSWDKEVPVIIRTDLVGDTERASAIAVAENSEDSRTNLNYIEIGKVVEKLSNAGWSTARIAKETGLHPQKVRRALTLVSSPPELQAKVEEGISIRTALEVAKLDEKTRKAVIAELTPNTAQTEIKKMRKDLELKAKTPDEKKALTKTPHRAITAWKGSRNKTAEIRRLCYYLSQAHNETDDFGTPDYHEVRGALAFALWDRGDLSSTMLTSVYVEDEDDPIQAKKANVAFMRIVSTEADQHTPGT
jgi:ParB family transcriptional regulator, chromosome partitioning protein